MRIKYFLLIFFLVQFQLYCQVEERGEQCLLKYGEDKLDWPKWCLGFNPSEGMSLDTLDFGKLKIDGQLLVLELNDNLIQNGEIEGGRLTLGPIVYRKTKNYYVFNEFTFQLDFNRSIRLNSGIDTANYIEHLDDIKAKFTNSYLWRDGVTNYVKSMIPDDKMNQMSFVPFFESSSNQVMTLSFYKELLVYISL